MRVLIAAAGTGGHIYPGIAVAGEVCRRDPESEVLFVGTARGLETRIVPAAGYQLSLIHSVGLKNVGVKGLMKGLFTLPRSFIEARQIVRSFRPDVAVGAGGYVSGPTLLAAAFSGVPTLIMDSNALPGFTNRRLARFVDKAALTFDESLKYFGGKGVVIGNPVRGEFFGIEPKARDGFLNLLIFGGSQGSRAINNAVTDALVKLGPHHDRIRITHQTGETDLDVVKDRYAGTPFAGSDIRPFISDIFVEFAKADLVISRAGATTCAELAAAGKAAIMIPLPTAADDHQRKNAEAFVRAGAARILLQQDLTGDRLANAIVEMLDRPAEITKMENAAKGLARPDAAERAVDLIEALANRKGSTGYKAEAASNAI